MFYFVCFLILLSSSLVYIFFNMKFSFLTDVLPPFCFKLITFFCNNVFRNICFNHFIGNSAAYLALFGSLLSDGLMTVLSSRRVLSSLFLPCWKYIFLFSSIYLCYYLWPYHKISSSCSLLSSMASMFCCASYTSIFSAISWYFQMLFLQIYIYIYQHNEPIYIILHKHNPIDGLFHHWVKHQCVINVHALCWSEAWRWIWKQMLHLYYRVI